MTDSHPSTDSTRLLGEADLLLREGLKRIASAKEDLPSAQSPLEEALQLTEAQTMATIAAVERAQETIQEIRTANGIFIDGHLDQLEGFLRTILECQQGQDLAGQRLKKAITLLRAVEERIAQVLQETGMGASSPDQPAVPSATINQDEVDALLAELGI